MWWEFKEGSDRFLLVGRDKDQHGRSNWRQYLIGGLNGRSRHSHIGGGTCHTQGTAKPRPRGRASTVHTQGALCKGGACIGLASWETSLGDLGQDPAGIISLLSVHSFPLAFKPLSCYKAGSSQFSSPINRVSI